MTAAQVAIGIDVGGTSVVAVALAVDSAEGAGTLVAEQRVATLPGRDGVLTSIDRSHDQVLRKLPAGATVVALGVGIPGVVGTGTVAHAVNLGIDEPLDLDAHLRGLVEVGGAGGAGGGPVVVVENDVTAAIRGAAAWLRETGSGGGSDLALLNVGTGLAAGLILDGVLRRGASGMAGEIGHLVVHPDGPRCRCGKHGCLELYASGGGLTRRWPGPVAQLMAAAADGDAKARAIADDLIEGIAFAIRTLVLTVDVPEVVLNGGMVQGSSALREAVTDRLAQDQAGSAFEQALGLADRLRWVPAGQEVGASGAALLAMDAVGQATAAQGVALSWRS